MPARWKTLPLVWRGCGSDGWPRGSNGAHENLGPTCRSCNAKVAHVMKCAGIGRRTRQDNTIHEERAQTLGQWMAAVMSMKGESDQMSVSDAVAIGGQESFCPGDLAIEAGAWDGVLRF